MKLLKMGSGLLVIFFLFLGCTTTGSMREPLIDAVESGDLERVKSELAEVYGNTWHMRDDNGKTLLHLATEYGHADIGYTVNYTVIALIALGEGSPGKRGNLYRTVGSFFDFFGPCDTGLCLAVGGGEKDTVGQFSGPGDGMCGEQQGHCDQASKYQIKQV